MENITLFTIIFVIKSLPANFAYKLEHSLLTETYCTPNWFSLNVKYPKSNFQLDSPNWNI